MPNICLISTAIRIIHQTPNANMILAQHAIIALCLFGLTTAWWGQGDDDYWDMERSAAVEDRVAGPYEPYGWEPSKPYNPGYDDSKGRSAKERSANRGRSGKRKTAKGRSAKGRSASVENRGKPIVIHGTLQGVIDD